jgi:hypothetical protein|tara:strand:+ start:410 stop:991 length:582 start_codon:yes stop_codon:yes gene_type:complete
MNELDHDYGTIDFARDQLGKVDDSEILSIASCCQKLVDLENEATTLEEQLKHVKEEMLSVRNEKIPALMQEKNLTQLKLNDGSSIEIKNFYGISVPKDPDQRAEAYQWLRDHDLGDIIKNEISARFGRNEDGKALEFSKLATANGYEVQQDLKVEPMTLKATLRELHEKGADLPPEEIFKTFVGRQAKVQRKK